MTVPPVIQLEQVTKSFRLPGGETVNVLDVPAFAVAEGEQCALEGQSGSGKSTLLHVISARCASVLVCPSSIHFQMLPPLTSCRS